MLSYLHVFDPSLLRNQILLMISRCIYCPRYVYFILKSMNYLHHYIGCNYGWTLMILFLFGRTWTNCLLKLKQLKGDTVCLKLLPAYLKFVDCQLHLCILLAVRETIMKLLPRTQSLKIKSLHILGNSNLHFTIQMEMEGHTRQVIQWLVNELADCAC